jgi:hypothetical protein
MADGGNRMATSKREFTAKDMKKAFEAGARVADGGSWAWQRWMRNKYPARYIRKAARKAGA